MSSSVMQNKNTIAFLVHLYVHMTYYLSLTFYFEMHPCRLSESILRETKFFIHASDVDKLWLWAAANSHSVLVAPTLQRH